MIMRVQKAAASVLVPFMLFAANGCRGGAADERAITVPANSYPWLGNQLGITNNVPPPWTPLQKEEDAVRYWGGTIDFAHTVLPTQISSQGVELLSRPVTLKIVTSGSALAQSETRGPQVVTQTEAQLTLTTVAGMAPLEISCIHSVAFDGMLRTDISLGAAQTITLNSLTLEVPLRAEVARYFRRFYLYDFDEMKVDRDDYIHSAGSTKFGWEIPFTPYVWLGRPDVGLEWFCESDHSFRPWGKPAALALRPTEDEVVLEVRVIREPLTLRPGEPWQMTFGLSPTPSRPRVPHWRSYRWGGRMDGPPIEVDPQIHNVFSIFWINEPGGLALRTPGLPWPLNPATFDSAKQRLTERHIKYVPYGSLFKVDTSIPEWAVFGKEWSGGRTMAGWKSRQGESQASSVDITVPSFQDYIVNAYVENIRQHDIDGLYFDFGAPGLNPINPNKPEGQWADQGIYYVPLFALRNLYQRLYVATETEKPGFLTIVHGMLPAMCASFVDANVGGEGVQALFNKSGGPQGLAERQRPLEKWYVPDYIAEWSLDWVIAQFGRGVSEFPVVIPEITKYNKVYYQTHPKEVEAYTRGMIALLALVDVHAIWLTNADTKILQRYSAAKAKFGPLNDDVEFHPFWAGHVVVDPPIPNVYPTLYTLPDRALLIVSNLRSTPATVTVDPQLEELGVALTQQQAMDAMTDQSIALDEGGKLALTVPAKDFNVVLLK
ncbi:MAG: glycoside hydrolase domain-containing protein [Candidatus Zipacnadales bacterium]